MKITMYELLGMIKDGKAPKKIRFKGRKWDYDEEFNNGLYTDGMGTFSIYGNELLEEVEILEEEKKIPEKLSTWFSVETKQSKELNIEYANTNFENMYEKINEIIDYLKSKGE